MKSTIILSVESGIKKYKTIIADPPWSYNNSGCRGSALNKYPTMCDQDIMDLPIGDLADNDSVLLLWATWPKLAEVCLPVVNSWGFQYVTGFPWVKIKDVSRDFWGQLAIRVPYGIGFWIRGCTEPILICKRGKPPKPKTDPIGLLSPNLFHSRKPESIYDYAESLEGPYLELFARRERTGWDCFGNEIENSIQL